MGGVTPRALSWLVMMGEGFGRGRDAGIVMAEAEQTNQDDEGKRTMMRQELLI